MNTIFPDIYSVYDALLVPFGTPDFGPNLATVLLLLAFVVFLSFLCVTAPQIIRLHAALNAIESGANKENAQQKRATFQSSFDKINAALLSNKATSAVWQEFCKTLIRRESSQRTILFASVRPQKFFFFLKKFFFFLFLYICI